MNTLRWCRHKGRLLVKWPLQINLGSAEECSQSRWRIMALRGLNQSQHKSDPELSFASLDCVSMLLNSWLSTVNFADPDAAPGQQEAFQATAHQHSPPQGLCYHRAMEHLTLKTQKHIGFPNKPFCFSFLSVQSFLNSMLSGGGRECISGITSSRISWAFCSNVDIFNCFTAEC